MRQAGQDRHGLRVRALIAVLWRAGLRISEALALNETDIDERRGSLLIRHGKGDKRREAGIDQFGFGFSPPSLPRIDLEPVSSTRSGAVTILRFRVPR
jgi:Phage integrase family